MKKTIVTFGLLSGLAVSLMMVATAALTDRIGYDRGEYVGYTIIVLSFLLVFFGIRSYRSRCGGITFLRAFAIGLSITVISCVCYVATWEILYYNFMPDFVEKYGAHQIETLKAAGATPAAIQARTEQVNKLKDLYRNPILNGAVTFLEPFPIGLVITLVSSVILRKKPDRAVQSPLPTSS